MGIHISVKIIIYYVCLFGFLIDFYFRFTYILSSATAYFFPTLYFQQGLNKRIFNDKSVTCLVVKVERTEKGSMRNSKIVARVIS